MVLVGGSPVWNLRGSVVGISGGIVSSIESIWHTPYGAGPFRVQGRVVLRLGSRHPKVFPESDPASRESRGEGNAT